MQDAAVPPGSAEGSAESSLAGTAGSPADVSTGGVADAGGFAVDVPAVDDDAAVGDDAAVDDVVDAVAAVDDDAEQPATQRVAIRRKAMGTTE